MVSTFGEKLKLFALSVDILGLERFKQVARLIEEYCRETLDIESTKLFISRDVDSHRGLARYALESYEIEQVRALRKSDGNYSSHLALAYDRQMPLWITSATGKQRLHTCDRFKDQWSGLKAIPYYRASEASKGKGIMTSIVVPTGGKENLGVLEFRSAQFIEATHEAKIELQAISETVGILLHLHRVAETQKAGTGQALERLKKLLTLPLPRLTKPKIFLASSMLAEKDVIDGVRRVLSEKAYTEKLDLVYWKAMDKPGNINQQLLSAIAGCRYGICYFSQRVGEKDYIDNINVVFEAGMFHGRVDQIKPVPASWIPIRERASPNLPFDFAQERILWVERNTNGSLKTKPFATAMRTRINALLS